MEASDLISYREQVATIETALQTDPHNAELLSLKTELLELISLTENLLQEEEAQALSTTTTTSSPATPASATAASSSTQRDVGVTYNPISPTHSPSRSGYDSPNDSSTKRSSSSAADPSKQPIYQPPPPVRHWSVGDRCRALFADDGKFYEATILSIGGSGQVFSVQYVGYETSAPALVGPQDLKQPYDHKKYQNKHQQPSGAAAATGTAGETEKGLKKRGADGGAGMSSAGPGAAKKKKGTGVNEQTQKQLAWQTFAKGGAKKVKGVAPILKKSIFATPDNPDGKVGVVGSGKGMTQFQQRGKHIYGQSAEPN
ncbi:hypothetical protein BGZ98_006171 [Dissophora globulifera]|nr:hypothetical protein BGZ98_006171 [Dissophora globulifera]